MIINPLMKEAMLVPLVIIGFLTTTNADSRPFRMKEVHDYYKGLTSAGKARVINPHLQMEFELDRFKQTPGKYTLEPISAPKNDPLESDEAPETELGVCEGYHGIEIPGGKYLCNITSLAMMDYYTAKVPVKFVLSFGLDETAATAGELCIPVYTVDTLPASDTLPPIYIDWRDIARYSVISPFESTNKEDIACKTRTNLGFQWLTDLLELGIYDISEEGSIPKKYLARPLVLTFVNLERLEMALRMVCEEKKIPFEKQQRYEKYKKERPRILRERREYEKMIYEKLCEERGPEGARSEMLRRAREGKRPRRHE